MVVKELTSDLGDAFLDEGKHRPQRRGSQAAEQARADGLNLAKDERLAGFDFVFLGRAISRRAALDDIAM